MEPDLIKAIGYCRNSTLNQKKGGTIKIQQKSIKDYCSKSDYNLIEIFSDEGISGTVEISRRPAFLKLLNFIEVNKEVKYLIIYSLDRIARDLMIQEQIISLLNKSGMTIISIREPDLFGTDPTRKFIRHILGAASEFEKSIITTRMMAGRFNKAMNGKYAGGRVPYGYSRVTKEEGINSKADLEIDEQQAEVVKQIHRLKLNNFSYRVIAKHLNNQKVESPRGKQWYAATVRYLLLNPLYKGELNYKNISSVRNDLAIV